MRDTTCKWNDMFDDGERDSLYNGLVYTGVLGVIFSAWISSSILMSDLRLDCSYKNLANFTLAQYFRRIIWLAIRLVLFRYFDTLKYCLEFFAFIDTFLDVFEIETLTHVCIERFVITKYLGNGWAVRKEHYTLFFYLSLLFSALYSIPPLFGLGRFGYDFTCDSFTFDMVLPNNWQNVLVVFIFILRSLKPVVFMATMLILVGASEENYNAGNIKQLDLTRSVIALTVANIICYTPIFLVRAFVVMCQIVMMKIVAPPTSYVKLAMWLHWFTPVITTMTMFVMDRKLSERMLDQKTFVGEKKQTKISENKDK